MDQGVVLYLMFNVFSIRPGDVLLGNSRWWAMLVLSREGCSVCVMVLWDKMDNWSGIKRASLEDIERWGGSTAVFSQ